MWAEQSKAQSDKSLVNPVSIQGVQMDIFDNYIYLGYTEKLPGLRTEVIYKNDRSLFYFLRKV